MLETSLDCFERAIEASFEDCHISERERVGKGGGGYVHMRKGKLKGKL